MEAGSIGREGENQTFRGNLILRARPGGTMAAINEIPLEAYLESVISSEMSASAPGGIPEEPRDPFPKLASRGAAKKEGRPHMTPV